MSVTTEYLQSYEQYFWHYEDQGKVIAVPGGRTIGYTDLIINEIVFHLASQGLPRFGSLLLAIAATTAHGLKMIEDIAKIADTNGVRTEEVERGIWFLKLLTQLPPKFKRDKLRILLLRVVFEHGHNSIRAKRSLQILKELNTNRSVTQHLSATRPTKLNPSQRLTYISTDFKTLAISGRTLKDVRTIMKQISGLPPDTHLLQTLQPEPEPIAGDEGDFADQLLNHRETKHIGALVTSLSSGLQLSLHASLPSEQALGGVADITNKGSFDKLLTSEYAFDDHILLSRLANNQALYKHREVPPVQHDNTRVLLIDCTLKNWGTIRTLAYATAIAIARHPKNKSPCRIFLLGQSYQETSVATVSEVIEGLSFLDSSLDPGVGLERLFAREKLPKSELFFIGAAASRAAPAMQRLIATGRRIDHWIHPEEDGTLRVYKNPKRGMRLIQELRIPLDQLWSGPEIKGDSHPHHHSTGYPILFPETRMKCMWMGKRFTYGLTKYRAIVRRYAGQDTSSAWEFISGGIRSADQLKAVITHDDLSISVLFGTDTDAYSIVTYPGGSRIQIGLNRRLVKAKNFYVHDDRFRTDLADATVSINLQGEVSAQRKFQSNKRTRSPRQAKPVNFFRQINHVSVTQDNKLRFKKHDLLVGQKTISIRHRNAHAGSKTTATETEEGVFVFPDGSQVIHNPSGMLTLVSADTSLSNVHLPTQLNHQIGMATADAFTGNAYYRMEPRIEILLHDAGKDKLDLIRAVKRHMKSIDLSHAKTMVTSGVVVCQNEESLDAVKPELAKYIDKIQRRGIQQQQVAPLVFYERYITPFVTHILAHGTKA